MSENATTTVSVETKELMRVLNLAGRCINSKPSIPIMGDVLFAYSDGRFIASASNSELWIDIPTEMRLDDGEFDSVCVNYAMLRNAVATLPDGVRLKMIFSENRLKVDYGKGKFSIVTESAANYPVPDFKSNSELAEKEAVCRLKISDGWFINNLKLARTCAAVETIRPTLSAVCVDVFKDKVNVVSTDAMVMYFNSHKFSEDALESADFEEKVQMIVSTSAVDAITGSFGNEELVVSADSRHVFVTSETGVKLVAQLTEGVYVNYEKILQSQSDYKNLKVAALDVLGALKRCNVFANEVSHMALLNIVGGSMRICVNNLDFATDCNEEISRADNTNVETDLTIGFNLVKLTSLIGVSSTQYINVQVVAEDKPIIIREDNEASELILMIMPIRNM